MLSRQTINAYTVLLAGVTLFLLRRLVLPTVFELEGLPFDIAAPSALNACYRAPALSTCSDGVIVTLAAIGVAVAAGWGSAGRMIFALILVVLPLGLYLVLSPVWIALALLILLPLALDLGARLLAPAG
ncbi:MAG TPA: hypothetical protein PKD53_00400 [Chloroflexaceae bacterium]|nr:hypothetical protein [Chloroflexaceae bacterium]